MAIARRSPALKCRWATATTAAPAAPRVIRINASPLRPDSDWPSLDYVATGSPLMAGWVHAVTLREVLADQVSTHSSIFHS